MSHTHTHDILNNPRKQKEKRNEFWNKTKCAYRYCYYKNGSIQKNHSLELTAAIDQKNKHNNDDGDNEEAFLF